MSNINIEYNYQDAQEILTQTWYILDFWILESSITLVLLLLLWSIIYYIGPIYRIIILIQKTTKDKKRKKLSLQQILVTKEIESEIEKEIAEEQNQRMQQIAQ